MDDARVLGPIGSRGGQAGRGPDVVLSLLHSPWAQVPIPNQVLLADT